MPEEAWMGVAHHAAVAAALMGTLSLEALSHLRWLPKYPGSHFVVAAA